MSLGSIALGFRQKFRHGLRVAYYRDVVRKRILETAPVEATHDRCVEIHVLTSAGDWLNLLWTLKTFYAMSKTRYSLCIHCDATVPAEAIGILRHHFPQGRVISRTEADAVVEQALAGFPKCQQFRKTNVLAPKVFDFITFLASDRMALFDSDLLFFSEPTEYLRQLEDLNQRKNVFNADIASAYTVTPQVVRDHAGMELRPLINSGLGLVHRSSIRFDWVEDFLKLPGLLDGHFWRIEQTLYALCSSRHGVELLSPDYAFYKEAGLQGRPFRHYIGEIRHLMYGEGMAELNRRGFLAGQSARKQSARPQLAT